MSFARHRGRLAWGVVTLAAVVVGCNGGQAHDAQAPDSGRNDAGASGPDAAADASASDGARDASGSDGSGAESAAPDATGPDAAEPDAAEPDAAEPDASMDAPAADSSVPGDGEAPDTTAPAGGDSGRGTDSGGATDSGRATDSGGVTDTAGPGSGETGPVNVCGAPSGSVAWTATIPSTASTLTIADVVVGPMNDVAVADRLGGATFEQHRWSDVGTLLGSHQDSLGAYTGGFWPSALFVGADDGLFYGMFMTGLVMGQNTQARLVFTKLSPSAAPLWQVPTTATMPTSSGAPTVTLFDSGGDSGGGLHGPLVMSGPQYFSPGVYCWGSSGNDEGPSAQSVTGMLTGGRSFEWPEPSGNLAVATVVTSNVNLGCGSVTVPAAGGILLAEAGGGSGCNWNKLLAVPSAAVLAYDFRLGADASTAFAVVYSGSINFGGGALQSTGSSSLALAHFDNAGNLLWSKTFGGAGSSFTIGDVHVNSAGILMVSAGYAGTVDWGGVTLPSTDNTVVAVFDTSGNLKWSKTATVTSPGVLRANIGACGVAVATNSPSVDFGAGALSTVTAPDAPTIGVAALGL
jgi:hypothetical protein